MDPGVLPARAGRIEWSAGTPSPVIDPVAELPQTIIAALKSCAALPPDVLPDTYGDTDGLWITIRRRNPFDVLMFDASTDPAPDALLVRARVLWKFWSQKQTVARQGATRAVIRQKYSDHVESFVENVQWAYNELSSAEGVDFWRKKIASERAGRLWARLSDSVEAALADGMLDLAETEHLLARGSYAGYERDEFARELREVLHARRFEPEFAPSGDTEHERLTSVRWATAEVWNRLRLAAHPPSSAEELYYVNVQSTGDVIGPVAASVVESWIRGRRLTAADSLCVVGGAAWQPLLHSRFGHILTMSQNICPRCGAILIVSSSSSATGWALIILGVLTLVIYIGLIFIIIGIVLCAQKTSGWRCPRCGYVP